MTRHGVAVIPATAALCSMSVFAQPPTFNRDIAPIIFSNCSECHRPGAVAPFSLLTYHDVKKRGRQIAEVTQRRFMPPWLPDRHDSRTTFHGERGLTDDQIRLIRAWVDGGALEGDPNELPPVPHFGEGWAFGEPDVTLTFSEPYVLPEQTNDTIRTFVLPVQWPEDRHVKAIDVRPNVARAVHHVSFVVDQTGAARQMDAADPQPGYPSMGDIGLNLAGSFGTWSPGGAPIRFESGIARLLPGACDLVIEMHFNPTGKSETIQPRIGLFFADEIIKSAVTSMSMGSFVLDIAAGAKQYTVRDSMTLPADVELLGLAPHAHYLCKRISVTAKPPDRESFQLLLIRDWDFNWQQEYRYEKAVALPAGTRIEMEFIYDNSAENPRNPHHPPKRVRAGATAADEMALLFLDVIAVDESQRPLLEEANHARLLERMRAAQRQRGQE